ncbi:hypothetical protein Tco_0884559 [Tanacetum coccineum]
MRASYRGRPPDSWHLEFVSIMNGVAYSKTQIVGGIWSGEYVDHGFIKSVKEVDMSYVMLKELRYVIVGVPSIHKNHEGSNHEGSRIHPTIGGSIYNDRCNQSLFNNMRVDKWEEMMEMEIRLPTIK